MGTEVASTVSTRGIYANDVARGYLSAYDRNFPPWASTAEAWRHSHNYIHHTYTNILGKDKDLGYEIMRIDPHQKWHPVYLLQPIYNLLLAAFRLLCRALRVERICAVADDHSVSRSGYFGSGDAQASYDTAWNELGGSERDDGYYDLPIDLHRRDADEIPSRKRAQYRRRYAMLEDLAVQIIRAVEAPQPVPSSSLAP